eukprot:TRINITY_DN20291_c0_g1_i4.p1 TRINITY_DN20291_c0_g1~~TRINITY_DN20291_c0_g1_i4.p1  ORF type:complete len:197 (+),score=36.88 TRINITY_DN20291_c0_g1_i4:124-714(+)
MCIRDRPSHMAERSLEFHLGLGESKNFARIAGGAEVDKDSAYALNCAVCVDPRDSPGDEQIVEEALREAATWGDPVAVRKLLSSCYCTPATTAAALGEAAAMGFCDVVALLLKAGSRATMRANGKTALHRACEAGQEEAARVLIQSVSSEDQAMCLTDSGKTAFELARDQDMCGLVRRLEAFLKEHLEGGNVVMHH